MRSLNLLLALLSLPALAFAQGTLTPPSAPAATMKTLSQIEPRIPLEDGIPGLNRETNGGFTIQNPGSYYLTGNLSVAYGDAITINSNTVTLDLNGFTLSSRFAGTAGSGITTATGASGITIRNGFVRGGVTSTAGGFAGNGFLHGITATNTHNVRVEGVTVQGLVGNGITLASGSGTIRACAARLCGGMGLRANQVIDSQARQCGATAIFAGTAPDAGSPVLLPVPDGSTANCYGESLTGSPGIFASAATNCYGKSDSGPGIEAKTATGCHGKSLSGTAIKAERASGCVGESTAGSGIDCTIASDSSGTSNSATGLSAGIATNCTGTSLSGWGLTARQATGCHGSTDTGTYGLKADSLAENCKGTITTAWVDAVGLSAPTATNCEGRIGTGLTSAAGYYSTGLKATTATNCVGVVERFSGDLDDSYAYGLRAEDASHCFGSAPVGIGVFVSGLADNCTGTIPTDYMGTGYPTDFGVLAESANHCRGSVGGGTGLEATTATDCSGSTVTGAIGICVKGNAANCYGSTNTGTYGLWVDGTASFCRGYNGTVTKTAISALIAVACTSEKGIITVLPGGSKQLGTP